jgi:4-amino-4-deoxy-L-arabinose transferase-like glycosyltransferase
VRVTLGESILAVRLVPALAGCSVIVLSGLMAREMGGGRTAQGIAALFTLSSSLLLGVSSTYTMNALEVMLWTIGAALVLRLTRSDHWGWWIGIGIVMGIGLLNKVSTAWFALGLGAGLLLTRERRWLATPDPSFAGALALAPGRGTRSPIVHWAETRDRLRSAAVGSHRPPASMTARRES